MDQKPDLNRLVQLAQTDAGQQLLAILSRSDSGQLSAAMEQDCSWCIYSVFSPG